MSASSSSSSSSLVLGGFRRRTFDEHDHERLRHSRRFLLTQTERSANAGAYSGHGRSAIQGYEQASGTLDDVPKLRICLPANAQTAMQVPSIESLTPHRSA